MIRCLVWGLFAAGVHIFLLPGSSVAQEENSDKFTYTNARFGFSFDFPAGFVADPPPANNDGRIFSGYEGDVKIVAFAGYILEDFEVDRARSRDYLRDGGADITYAADETNWFVTSGYDVDGLIFYNRVIKTKDCSAGSIAATVSIVYPRSHKETIEPNIDWISTSLRGCR